MLPYIIIPDTVPVGGPLSSSYKIVNHKVPSETRSQIELTNAIYHLQQIKETKLRHGSHSQTEAGLGNAGTSRGRDPLPYNATEKSPFHLGSLFPFHTLIFPLKSSRPSSAHAQVWNSGKASAKTLLHINNYSRRHQPCATMFAGPTQGNQRDPSYRSVFLKWIFLIPFGLWRGILDWEIQGNQLKQELRLRDMSLQSALFQIVSDPLNSTYLAEITVPVVASN